VLERLLENPRSIHEWSNAVRLLTVREWQPERFVYILNHVIIASKRLGMGRDPGKLLSRLEETKASVLQNPGQSDPDKELTLKIVAEAQREAGRTDKAFAELPAQEVRLMWIYREEIRRVLEDHLPMRKRDLPNPNKAP
jgi:hypothetical protein